MALRRSYFWTKVPHVGNICRRRAPDSPKDREHQRYELQSKILIKGLIKGSTIGVIKRDTRSAAYI